MKYFTCLFYLVVVVLTFGCKKKLLEIKNFQQDSIAMNFKYDSVYFSDQSQLKNLHQLYIKSNDSLLQGLNHQLYSDYLARNSNFDSAYYYLSLADNYFKSDTLKLFYNSFKKTYLTNRISLFSHSITELKKAEKMNTNDENLKKLYIEVFSLPVLKEYDSLAYKNAINNFLKENKKRDSIMIKSSFLENYKANQVYSFLSTKKEYKIIEQLTSKRISELLNEHRTNEDLFFSNLYYIIQAKIQLGSKGIDNYFNFYEKYKSQALTKETETLLYILKSTYFEKSKQGDSAVFYMEKALSISNQTGNLLNERLVLKQLLQSPKEKGYIEQFIKINDSLSYFKGYMDDFIFSTNSSLFELQHEQETIQKLNLKILFLSFVIFFSLILSFLLFRNSQINKLAKKHKSYLDKKAKMYNYLIEIKDRLDATILRENENIKHLISSNGISKIDAILEDLESENTNLEDLQKKIQDLEDESRNISHVIASENYKTVNLAILLNDLKIQYRSFFKIETFIDPSISLKDLNFKEILRTLLFTQTFLDKLRYKKGITCFISVYKKKHLSIYKIWINRTCNLTDEEIQFLQDRNIEYDFFIENESTHLLIHIKK